MSAEVVTLRTGAEVPAPAVREVCIALASLYDNNPVAFYQAVQLARDAAHVTFGSTGADLAQLGLAEDGRMHDVTRDVILAATDGEDFGLHLTSPYPAPEASA